MRPWIVTSFCLCIASVSLADEKADKAAEIRQKIGRLQKEIRELEVKALTVEGMPYIGPVKDSGIPGSPVYSLRDGDKGHFGAHVYRIEEVLSDRDGFYKIRAGDLSFLVHCPACPNLVEDSKIQFVGEWKVKRDQPPLRGKTYFRATPGKDGTLKPF